MPTNLKGVKRYSLVLPERLFDEVQEIADNQNTSVLEVIRKFIKLGLVVSRVVEKPDTALILREGEIEREILLI